MAYKVIHDTFWTDPKIKKLKPEIKLLYLYLITNHHSHYSGIYYLPLDMISLETGMTKKVIKASFDILIKLKFIKHDESMAIIWIINMAKYQINGTKQVKGAANHLATLHNCTLIKEFLELYNTLAIPYRYPIEGVYGEYHKEEEEETVTEEETEEVEVKPETKNIYGEFQNVKLSEDEHKKLSDKFNGSLTDKIETLSGYKKSKGVTYKDDYATILNWARKEEKDGKKSGFKTRKQRNTEALETYLNEAEKGEEKDITP